jgi:hypothetical protein
MSPSSPAVSYCFKLYPPDFFLFPYKMRSLPRQIQKFANHYLSYFFFDFTKSEVMVFTIVN